MEVFRQAPQEGSRVLKQRAQCTEVILKVNYVSENYLKTSTREFERMYVVTKSEFLFLEKVKWSSFYFILIGLQRSKVSARIEVSCVACMCVCSVRLTLRDPRDCSPPGSSVHGISQARTLELVAISTYRGSSGTDPGIKPASLASPALAGGFFTNATPGKPNKS